MLPDERHYNRNKLNLIFSLSSILLLLSLGWLFLSDYVRQWKHHQTEFRTLEIAKTEAKYEETRHTLEHQQAYQDLLKKMDKARKDHKTQSSGLEDLRKGIAQLRAKSDLSEQEYKFAKSELDAARYRYEAAKEGESKNLEETQAEFLKLDQRVKALKLAAEESNQKLREKETIIDRSSEDLRSLERDLHQMTSQKDVLERKLKIIDPNAMSLATRVADKVRDLPVIDFANPSVKIQQIVLRDITDNVNFMQTPKVDRCVTCHLGITNPDYKDAPQPYRTHPNLDLYLGKNSPHPIEEFGCTVCHGGRGRGTDFTSAAHIPSKDGQEEEWKRKYQWTRMELWDEPMLPLQYVEAGCFKCHSSQVTIRGAEKLNLGIHLVEKAGCFNCHLIKQYEDWPKSGPSLRKLDSKLAKEWAYRWIENPRSFRHNTWMPTFFNQSNNGDPESKKRTQQEILAMVHYLVSASEAFDMQPIPVQGNAERGKELVSSVGCLACHQIQKIEDNQPTTRDLLRRQHGPNLIGLGSKTTKGWIYNWLKDPKRYNPQTRMPNLRLTDQEAADIAEFLVSDQNDDFDKKSVPEVNEPVIDEMMLGFLTKMETHAAAKQKVASMDLNQKLSFSGERLINHYGCYACHDIKGFEHANPVGTELTEEGSKSVHKLDFGLTHLDHTNFAWFAQKLRNPRIFDGGKVKAPDEKLKMPNFYFTDEETDALVTALMGFVDTTSVERKKMPRTTRNLHLEAGQKVVHLYNCQGCHVIEGDGGTIRPTLKEWLVKYDNRTDAEADALVPSFSPPNLVGEGKKVHTEWLFHFLHEPTVIRPWLKARMPTFNFNATRLNALVKYFNELDREEFPFTESVDTTLTEEEHKAALKLFSKEYFDCAQCHIVGNKLPPGSPDRWAPNFALAKERLKPQWIIEWLKNPAALLPGTKMPTYFDPATFEDSGPPELLNGNENEQIRVLRNYLLTLSEENKPEPEKTTQDSPAKADPSTRK